MARYRRSDAENRLLSISPFYGSTLLVTSFDLFEPYLKNCRGIELNGFQRQSVQKFHRKFRSSFL